MVTVLNLYASLGGNRYKWDDICDIAVTAVELDPYLAELYQERFPNDTVFVEDAHQFLLENYSTFDYIWSSPPCPSHSRARFARKATTKPLFPDLKLYEEIIFLDKWFKGKYCVENVIPYYKPLIDGQVRGRHIYWANYEIPQDIGKRGQGILESKSEVEKLSLFHDYDFNKYKGSQRRDKVARNLVDYEDGAAIFKSALSF